MKVFRWILISFAILIPAALAAEQAAVESAALPKPVQNMPSIPFSMTVAQNGTLTSKPGPVFTEGGDYEGLQLPYLVAAPEQVHYPRWAVMHGWEGEFVIAAEILTDGTVGRTKTMKSTGHRMLDNIATASVRTWKFHPAMKNGQPVRTCIQLPVTFQLGSE